MYPPTSTTAAPQTNTRREKRHTKRITEVVISQEELFEVAAKFNPLVGTTARERRAIQHLREIMEQA